MAVIIFSVLLGLFKTFHKKMKRECNILIVENLENNKKHIEEITLKFLVTLYSEAAIVNILVYYFWIFYVFGFALFP